MPLLQIEYYPYTTITHTIRLRHGNIKVRMSHLFRQAPNDVLVAVAHILFSKLYRQQPSAKALDRYHQFVERRQNHLRTLLNLGAPGRWMVHMAKGKHHDLEIIFEHLNRAYFHSRLPKPTLGWSRRGGKSKLGEYQNLRHAIIINRRFDHEETPPFALEYLMFHEMLHMKHGVEIRNGRRLVHTPAFHLEEKAFKHYAAAREWIRKATMDRGWREDLKRF